MVNYQRMGRALAGLEIHKIFRTGYDRYGDNLTVALKKARKTVKRSKGNVISRSIKIVLSEFSVFFTIHENSIKYLENAKRATLSI